MNQATLHQAPDPRWRESEASPLGAGSPATSSMRSRIRFDGWPPVPDGSALMKRRAYFRSIAAALSMLTWSLGVNADLGRETVLRS